MKVTRQHLRQMLSEIIELEEVRDNVTPTEVTPGGHEETPAWYTSLVNAIDTLHANGKETRDKVNKITNSLKKSGLMSEQKLTKLTRQYLRQIIKEEAENALDQTLRQALNDVTVRAGSAALKRARAQGKIDDDQVKDLRKDITRKNIRGFVKPSSKLIPYMTREAWTRAVGDIAEQQSSLLQYRMDKFYAASEDIWAKIEREQADS